MSVDLNDSVTATRSDVGQSAFLAKKSALEIENELDTIKKRIKKIQIEEEKKSFQKKHLLNQMDKLKQIYVSIQQDKQER